MKKIISLLIICLMLFTCEKDDICEVGAAITPQLIVTFYDSTNPSEKKDVDGLLVFGVNDNNEPVLLNSSVVSTTDSIAFPLRTETDITKIVFHKNYSVDNNGTPDDTSDDIVLGNQDVIDFNYMRNEIYVSRACGFKMNFNDLNPVLQSDSNNWIINTETSNTTIDNETEAHVKIYH